MQNKKLPTPRLFTSEEWEEADPLEKLYIHLMQPDEFPLSASQEVRLETLRQAWAVMCSKMNTWRRIKLIRKVFEVGERTAYRYMEEAQWLFGEVLKTDAEIDLVLLKDKYYSLAERAEMAGDFDTARRCYDSALAIVKRIEENRPKEKKRFATIIFTSNPAALTPRSEDAEDADFEDLPQGRLLEREAT